MQQLDRSLKLRRGQPDLSYATDALFLAMAHQRLDHGPEAKQWLEQQPGRSSRSRRRDRLKVGTLASAAEPWYNRLVLQRLREEAEALVH